VHVQRVGRHRSVDADLGRAACPDWNTTESIIVEVPLKTGRKLTVPPVVVTSVAVSGETPCPVAGSVM
jgi:hypothetical protein